MGEINYNGFVVSGELKNDHSGFCRWGFGKKDGETYFIKEFLSPVYPENTEMFTPKQVESKKKACEEFEQEKKELYRQINANSNGNAVRIENFFRCGSKYYIVMEQVKSIALNPQDVAGLPKSQRLLFCKILAHTLAGFHRAGIVHADIKWDNILFCQGSGAKGMTVKLIDFDNSFFDKKPPLYADDLNIDQIYCAPEAFLFLNEEPVSLDWGMDVFALGIVFHQIYTGKLPRMDEQYQYLYEAKLDEAEVKLEEELPPYLAEIIEGMLEREAKRRLSMAEVFQKLGEEGRKENAEWEIQKESKTVETPAAADSEEKGEKTAKSGKSFFHAAGDL